MSNPTGYALNTPRVTIPFIIINDRLTELRLTHYHRPNTSNKGGGDIEPLSLRQRNNVINHSI